MELFKYYLWSDTIPLTEIFPLNRDNIEITIEISGVRKRLKLNNEI